MNTPVICENCKDQNSVITNKDWCLKTSSMNEKTRRKTLGLTAGALGTLTGCSALSDTDSDGKPTATEEGEQTRYQLQKLQDVLLEDSALRENMPRMFVGNPNFYSFHETPLTARVSSDEVADESASEVFQTAAEERDQNLGDLLDSNFNDPLSYDLLVEEDLDIVVYNASTHDIEDDTLKEFSREVESLTGLKPAISLEQDVGLGKNEYREKAVKQDDKLVYGFLDDLGNVYGRSAHNENFVEMNSEKVLANNSDEATVNAMLHEFLHSAINFPHIPVGTDHLMFRTPENPEDVEISQQTEDLVERYMSSELSYSAEDQDSETAYKVGFEPQKQLGDGEEYLVENTEFILDIINFPREKYEIKPDQDTIKLSREGYVAELYPSDKHLYQDVRVS